MRFLRDPDESRGNVHNPRGEREARRGFAACRAGISRRFSMVRPGDPRRYTVSASVRCACSTSSPVNEVVPPDQEDAVREAVHSCPEQAISIEE